MKQGQVVTMGVPVAANGPEPFITARQSQAPQPICPQPCYSTQQPGSANMSVPPNTPTRTDDVTVLSGDAISIHMRVPPNTPTTPTTPTSGVDIGSEDKISI